MDFSGFLVIPIAALVAMLTIVTTAAVPKWRTKRWFPLSVGLSIFFGMILMQPWRALSLHSWAMLPAGFGFIAIWAVTGCLIGAAPTLLAVKVVRLARRKS